MERRGSARHLLTSPRIYFLFVGSRGNSRRSRTMHESKSQRIGGVFEDPAQTRFLAVEPSVAVGVCGEIKSRISRYT